MSSNRSFLVRMVCPGSCSLDCTYSRHITDRSWSARHICTFLLFDPNYFCSTAYYVIDGHSNILRGRFYCPCRFRHSSQHCPTLNLRCAPSTCGPQDVCHTRPRVGQQPTSLHCAGVMSDPVGLSKVWREDQDDSEVSGSLVGAVCPSQRCWRDGR